VGTTENNGELTGFEYNGLPYYYRKNLFGDIVEIYDDENQLAASYTYDAWGNFTVGTNVDGIAFVNKFRYRGYYYDSDTGYYYLQTRYYDAEVGRFINADDVKYLNPKIIHGCNLYAYCGNNPIIHTDKKGTSFFKDAVEWIKSKWNKLTKSIKDIKDRLKFLTQFKDVGEAYAELTGNIEVYNSRAEDYARTIVAAYSDSYDYTSQYGYDKPEFADYLESDVEDFKIFHGLNPDIDLSNPDDYIDEIIELGKTATGPFEGFNYIGTDVLSDVADDGVAVFIEQLKVIIKWVFKGII